ncbi:glycosyl hydrolase family 28-related protein [Streptomyces tateyamensis]|uniref:glycosyl hydrolase family 28-related protein n=1 Tax=Streptomyces tateyamensis TaxID=565073 RepID=UPI0024830B04|nr:glycosyl hydrolase family 28-related protein [Streptomyces tateyamensis]
MAGSATGPDWFNVRDYGAKGDGAADDTVAVQAALDAAVAGGGGTVYFPAGQYLVLGLAVKGNGVKLVGAGSKAATLVKGGNGTLLAISGPATDPSGASHRRYCSVESLGFNGNNKTGLLLELYYNDNTYVRDVYMSSNNDVVIDAVECWDSRYYNLVIEGCSGTADSTSQPNVYLRNSAAASGYGYSGDNNNQLHFVGCRLEAFGTGAIWVTAGVNNANNPNGIYLTDCKFETSQMQGGPHLKTDASCRHVYASNIYCYAGNFASTYTSKKAQNIVAWAASFSALENVLIANGSVATVNAGVDLYSGPGSTAVVRNVIGQYATAPAGPHIYYEPSAGDFRVEASWGTVGAQASGAVPAKNAPNPPLRLVAGVVSDASFTHPPLDGTVAVDTTDNRLYVRVNGSWRWAALN